MTLTRPIDIVRLKVGDTNPADPLLEDDELETYLDNWPDNVELAAADAAEAIAAKFSRDYGFQTAEGQRFDRNQRVTHYMDLAKSLRSRGGGMIWPSPRVTARRLVLRWDLA